MWSGKSLSSQHHEAALALHVQRNMVMATGRVSHIVYPRPTGRYVYESSSEEDEYDEGARYVPMEALASDDDSDSEWDAPDRATRQSMAHIRLANELDPWERWENVCEKRAWERVRRARTLEPSVRAPAPTYQQDTNVDEVQNMLARFQIQQRAVEQKEREGFEKRNAKLWEGIELAIRQAELRAADEAKQLAEARKKQEEAEVKAKLARDAELARIESEKKEQEAKKREEEAKVRAQAEQNEKERAANVYRGGSHVWETAQTEYAHWQERMKYVKQNILPNVAQRSDWRKQCFAAKRAITPKIGQLTNSSTEIARITAAISDVLQQARDVPDADAATCLYFWMLNHLAKCLIRQAEQEVAARQQTAFPLARLIIGLQLRGHAAVGDVLMARLVKKCPWVLAYLPNRGEEDDASYRKRLGFKTADEPVQMYSARIAGISALYFACLQTNLDSVAACVTLAPGVSLSDAAQHIPDALRPGRLWTWQIRSMTPPVAEQRLIMPLWCTFLEMAGPVVLQRYKKQQAKLLTLLLQEGLRKNRLGEQEADDTQKAARVRLTLLLETWLAKQTFGELVSPGRDMDT